MTSCGPGGVRIEIRPLARTRRTRARLLAAGMVLVACALLGAARLGAAWEAGLTRGSFGDLPLPLLVGLSMAVGLSTPVALLGLAALAFAEETVEVGPDEITITTTAFERTGTVRIPRSELECWKETYLPIPPWWTWTVRRLAARCGGRLYPLAGAAGPVEKRLIGATLAGATGRPLLDPFGRRVPIAAGPVSPPGA